MASKSETAAAMATFKESLKPAIGIEAVCVRFEMHSAVSPSSSEPTTIAVGCA